MMRLLRALALLAFLVTAPAAALHDGAASTPTRLYFHLQGLQDFPINTQEPEGDAGADYGLATHTVSCLAAAGPSSRDWHTLYGYSTPSFVEYQFEENGGPRIHRDRGLGLDVQLDLAHAAVGHWFLETRATPMEPYLAAAVPDVIVRFTVREGDEVSVDNSAFNEGRVILQGQTEPATLSPLLSGHPHVSHASVEGRDVYHFQVPLGFLQDRIPAHESFNVRVDVLIDNPLCESGLMPNTVRPFVGPERWPGIELGVLNALRIDHVEPQLNGTWVFSAAAQSPWGAYDVRPEARLILEGPGHRAELEPREVVQYTWAFGHHHEPVQWVFEWDPTDAPEGFYTATFTAENFQGTANVTAVAHFHTDGRAWPVGTEPELDDRESPLGAVALLAVLAFLVRRRR